MAVRFLLQGTALRASIADGGADWEEKLSRTYERLQSFHTMGDEPGKFLEFLACYSAFHRALISACRLSKLLALLDIVFDQSSRYCRPADFRAEGAADVRKPMEYWRDPEGHERILLAALQRDPEAACEELRFHLLARISVPLEDQVLLN